MKIAIYPGSFNPFHQKHYDVVKKALMMFDKVIIAPGRNANKTGELVANIKDIKIRFETNNNVEVFAFSGLLKDFALNQKATAIIKGLRDINDFLYEQKQQYWDEDLGIHCPTVYIISDRQLVHVSSSAIRTIDKIKG